MRPKRCEVCGCIMYGSSDTTICECCLDDMREEAEDGGTGEKLRE